MANNDELDLRDAFDDDDHFDLNDDAKSILSACDYESYDGAGAPHEQAKLANPVNQPRLSTIAEDESYLQANRSDFLDQRKQRPNPSPRGFDSSSMLGNGAATSKDAFYDRDVTNGGFDDGSGLGGANGMSFFQNNSRNVFDGSGGFVPGANAIQQFDEEQQDDIMQDDPRFARLHTRGFVTPVHDWEPLPPEMEHPPQERSNVSAGEERRQQMSTHSTESSLMDSRNESAARRVLKALGQFDDSHEKTPNNSSDELTKDVPRFALADRRGSSLLDRDREQNVPRAMIPRNEQPPPNSAMPSVSDTTQINSPEKKAAVRTSYAGPSPLASAPQQQGGQGTSNKQRQQVSFNDKPTVCGEPQDAPSSHNVMSTPVRKVVPQPSRFGGPRAMPGTAWQPTSPNGSLCFSTSALLPSKSPQTSTPKLTSKEKGRKALLEEIDLSRINPNASTMTLNPASRGGIFNTTASSAVGSSMLEQAKKQGLEELLDDENFDPNDRTKFARIKEVLEKARKARAESSQRTHIQPPSRSTTSGNMTASALSNNSGNMILSMAAASRPFQDVSQNVSRSLRQHEMSTSHQQHQRSSQLQSLPSMTQSNAKADVYSSMKAAFRKPSTTGAGGRSLSNIPEDSHTSRSSSQASHRSSVNSSRSSTSERTAIGTSDATLTRQRTMSNSSDRSLENLPPSRERSTVAPSGDRQDKTLVRSSSTLDRSSSRVVTSEKDHSLKSLSKSSSSSTLPDRSSSHYHDKSSSRLFESSRHNASAQRSMADHSSRELMNGSAGVGRKSTVSDASRQESLQYTARRSEPTKAASLSQIEKNSTLTSSLASLKLGSSAQDVNATAESRATSSATVRASDEAGGPLTIKTRVLMFGCLKREDQLKLPVEVKNHSEKAIIVKLIIEPETNVFDFPEHDTMVSIAPGETHRSFVTFRPHKYSRFSARLRFLCVNVKDRYTLPIVGICGIADVMPLESDVMRTRGSGLYTMTTDARSILAFTLQNRGSRNGWVYLHAFVGDTPVRGVKFEPSHAFILSHESQQDIKVNLCDAVLDGGDSRQSYAKRSESLIASNELRLVVHYGTDMLRYRCMLVDTKKPPIEPITRFGVAYATADFMGESKAESEVPGFRWPMSEHDREAFDHSIRELQIKVKLPLGTSGRTGSSASYRSISNDASRLMPDADETTLTEAGLLGRRGDAGGYRAREDMTVLELNHTNVQNPNRTNLFGVRRH